MFWNRAIESYCVLSASKLCPVCVECCAVERWPFEELGLLKNNYRWTLAAPSVLFHTYMTAVQTAQLHIPHPLSYTPLSVSTQMHSYIHMHIPIFLELASKNNEVLYLSYYYFFINFI